MKETIIKVLTGVYNHVRDNSKPEYNERVSISMGSGVNLEDILSKYPPDDWYLTTDMDSSDIELRYKVVKTYSADELLERKRDLFRKRAACELADPLLYIGYSRRPAMPDATIHIYDLFESGYYDKLVKYYAPLYAKDPDWDGIRREIISPDQFADIMSQGGDYMAGIKERCFMYNTTKVDYKSETSGIVLRRIFAPGGTSFLKWLDPDVQTTTSLETRALGGDALVKEEISKM